MILGSFNPRNVKPGQWFSRVWRHGLPTVQPERLRVVKVLPLPTGKQYQFSTETGQTLQVCFRILERDFLRVCTESRQPFIGEDLAEITKPTESKKYWYEEDD